MMKDTMTYKGFIGSVHFSAEDRCLHGKIEAIDDLVSYEGDTVAGLEKAFSEGVNDYIELCKEVGKEPQKSFRGSFNVRVGAEVHRQAARMAIIQGKNLNTFVEEAIRARLGMDEAIIKRKTVVAPTAKDAPRRTTYAVVAASGKTVYRGTLKTAYGGESLRGRRKAATVKTHGRARATAAAKRSPKAVRGKK